MKDNIRTVRFQPFHLKLFKEGREYGRSDAPAEFRALMFRQVEGVTVLHGKEIVGCFGVCMAWGGVAEATLVPSDVFYTKPKLFTRLTRDLLDVAAQTYNLHRIQALCMEKYPKHGRFVQALGFEKEGIVKAYDSDRNDYGMYAKHWD